MAEVQGIKVTREVKEDAIQLTITLEEAACLLEYLADSGLNLRKGISPLDGVFMALQDHAVATKEIPYFTQYPAKHYGWEVTGEKTFRKYTL